MSFSWWCKDKDGKDLFAEFGVNPQGHGLGPNSAEDTDAPYRLSDIRSHWSANAYAGDLDIAAQDNVRDAQAMALENRQSLKPNHCRTCTCPEVKPRGWSAAAIDRFLAIPAERVWRAGGGY